jgi:hypothetical protein
MQGAMRLIYPVRAAYASRVSGTYSCATPVHPISGSGVVVVDSRSASACLNFQLTALAACQTQAHVGVMVECGSTRVSVSTHALFCQYFRQRSAVHV